jgi:acyl carrier protein
VNGIICSMLVQRGADPVQVMANDFDYIKAGLVDSLSLLRFVMDLEVEFGVEISNEEIVSPEFRTVGGLVALLERKLK